MKLPTLVPKFQARQRVLKMMTSISPKEVSLKTDKIIERLSGCDDFVHAERIHIYISTRPGEVDTRKIINFADGWGKQIILPKFYSPTSSFRRFQFMGWDELIQSRDGYWEPRIAAEEDMSDIDLVIVPAMAVSLTGIRIGRGGGYYDKLLKNAFAPKYVVAFEFQVFDYIESDIHDIRVDKIITELRVINTREKSRWN